MKTHQLRAICLFFESSDFHSCSKCTANSLKYLKEGLLTNYGFAAGPI